MKIKRKLLGAAALFAMFAATGANAQQSQGMDVTAIVPDACVIDNFATNLTMDFGNVNGTTGADETQDATLSWRCSIGTNATVAISGGANGVEAARLMSDGGTETLAYNIYQDAGLSTLWGTAGNANSTGLTGLGLGVGNSVTTTIYGVIRQADAEAATPGTYSDLVTITISP